uniref:Uncharacterized protein n=1 Tax=Panagrolaimus sp. JU765 TaxID=591449 RepID=A0AC34QJ48_9BILA
MDVNKLVQLFEQGDVIPYVEEVLLNLVWVSTDYEEFVHLKEKFPNAKKLTITYTNCVEHLNRFQEIWDEKRKRIEDAPQQEIIANIYYPNYFRPNFEQAIAPLHGEKINENTFRWTSSKNKCKMINLYER